MTLQQTGIEMKQLEKKLINNGDTLKAFEKKRILADWKKAAIARFELLKQLIE